MCVVVVMYTSLSIDGNVGLMLLRQVVWVIIESLYMDSLTWSALFIVYGYDMTQHTPSYVGQLNHRADNNLQLCLTATACLSSFKLFNFYFLSSRIAGCRSNKMAAC